jgi:hypothetical protein
MSDRIVRSFRNRINNELPLPEENVARPEFVGYRFRCASSASGFSQPTVIRLRVSTKLRIRVSGTITTLVDRTNAGTLPVDAMPFVEEEVM